MSTDEKYNGWSNRETWALMLHINNDQGLYEEFRELAREYGKESPRPAVQDAVRQRVENLLDPDEFREQYDADQTPEVARMAYEVGSVWRVNWSEVVDALTEE